MRCEEAEDEEEDQSARCRSAASSADGAPGWQYSGSIRVNGGVLSLTRFLTGDSWVEGISLCCLPKRGQIQQVNIHFKLDVIKH